MSGPRASITPLAVQSGERVEVTINGLPVAFAGRSGEMIVIGVDRIETHWHASVSGTVGGDGSLVGGWEPSLADETVLEAARVRLAPTEDDGERIWELSGGSIGRCIVGGDSRERTPEEINRRAEELRATQEARYAAPVGDPGAAGAREYRALCVVERLRSTRELQLPGGRLIPLTVGNPGGGEPQLIDGILAHLGWPSRIDTAWWAEHSVAGRPWTAIVISPVWAADHDKAAALAWDVRDRLIDVLALTRGSSARPLVTVVEQRQHPSGVKWRIYQEDEGYRGNLVGGFIAGEDQRELLMANAAMRADPLLALCVRLFRDAQRETDVDAAYFRYWSLLETLSSGRLGTPHQAVTLLDGSTWPGKANTTEFASPRVYALIAGHLVGIDEKSSVTPAASLYEAVRAWYSRRNATGHYGRFNDADPVQQTQSWFTWAVKTKSPSGSGMGPLGEPWLWALQQIASLVLRRELASVGRAAV